VLWAKQIYQKVDTIKHRIKESSQGKSDWW